MKKVLYLSNIPAPYRIDYFNELGNYFDLTVIFEAKSANNQGITFDWNYEKENNFECVFLSKKDINEKQVNPLIFKYIKKNKYDVIVSGSYAYFTEMAAIMKLKLFRIPHYMEVDGGLIRRENMLKRALKTLLIRGAIGYFSPSANTDRYLIHYGVKKNKIHRYPFTSLKNENVLETPLLKEEKKLLRKKLNISARHVVLAVGQFIPRKGFDLLIKASKKFVQDTEVYIIGGKVTEEYQELICSENISNVHFLEFMSKKKLREYYMAADIFVFPTREDIWGLVINEAMSFGLPVVTTDMCVAGVELIKNEENGYIIHTESVQEIVHATNKILESEKLCLRMGQNNLNKIKQYTIEKMAEAHAKVWSQGE